MMHALCFLIIKQLINYLYIKLLIKQNKNLILLSFNQNSIPTFMTFPNTCIGFVSYQDLLLV